MSATSAMCSMRSRPWARAVVQPCRPCPAYVVPEEIASLVRDKERNDELQFADLSRRNIATAPIKTNADGGMHPVFVEAVKKNQIGVAPQEPSFLVSTAPGTIPATVRPPRIPELASAPVVAGTGWTPAIPRGRADPDGHCRDQTRCPAGGQVDGRQPVRQPVRLQAGRSQDSRRRHARAHGPSGRPARQRHPNPRKWKPPPRRNRSRPPSRPAWLRMARSAPGRPRPNRSRLPRRKPRPLPPLRLPYSSRRRAGKYGDERRRPGCANRQLRQPLVRFPINDHDIRNEIAGQMPGDFFGGCHSAKCTPVAVLVLLARAAWALFVAANLAPGRWVVRLRSAAGLGVMPARARVCAPASASASSSSPVDGSTCETCIGGNSGSHYPAAAARSPPA